MVDDSFAVGYVPVNHAKELAKLLCAFMTDLCHRFLHVYGNYGEDSFRQETAFKDYTVMVCTDKELVDYIETTLLSVKRWIQYQRLEGFAVVLVDDDENVAYSYQINFFKPEVRVKKKIADFLVYVTELREKFFAILKEIRRGRRSPENEDKSLRFRILCKLIPETSTAQRPREYLWQKVHATADVDSAILLPCGTRIDNPIVQADFYGKEHRCHAVDGEEKQN